MPKALRPRYSAQFMRSAVHLYGALSNQWISIIIIIIIIIIINALTENSWGDAVQGVGKRKPTIKG